jgi:hypothetical protein
VAAPVGVRSRVIHVGLPFNGVKLRKTQLATEKGSLTRGNNPLEPELQVMAVPSGGTLVWHP